MNQTTSAGERNLLVSIITIVYNGERHLEQTIQSVLNQTYPFIEYIIIDGGSSDKTIDIIKKYDSKITKWKSEPDHGISDAFNKGLALATGELIGIINADDWYESDAVSQAVSAYTNDCLIHGNVLFWNNDYSEKILGMPNQNMLLKEMSLNHPTVFISKSLYAKFGGYSLDYKLAMDYHFLLKLYNAGIKFTYLNQTITNMRLGGASSNWMECYREVLRAKNEVLGYNKKNQIDFYWHILRGKVSKAISNTTLSFIKRLYNSYLSPMRKIDTK